MSIDNGVPFVKWAKIGGLHNVCASVKRCQEFHEEKGSGFEPYNLAMKEELTYRGKVKLHGMNCGVSITRQGLMRAQSRNMQFDSKDAKVAQIAYKHEQFFRTIIQHLDKEDYVKGQIAQATVFGEWCGKGVQKGVACSEVDNFFAVFSIQLTTESEAEAEEVLIVEPSDITSILSRNGSIKLPERIHVLPWHTSEISMDYRNDDAMAPSVSLINTEVAKIDNNDPWVEEVFKVKGPGEGLVLYPVSLKEGKMMSLEKFEGFAFKAKGEKHRVVATKKSAQTKAPVASNVVEFVTLMCTEARLEQGVGEVGAFKPNTSKFIKWILDDIQKESKAELEANNLTWKKVQGQLRKTAATWFQAKCAAAFSLSTKH